MGLNTFAVTIPPTKIAQYQVIIGSGGETLKARRGISKKAWHSKAVQSKLPNPNAWIFDGNTLAWSMDDMEEFRANVDLDADAGKPPRRDGKANIHRVIIKRTAYVDFASLTAYMNGKLDFNNKCLEAVTFMDHLMRETPSKTLSSIKRSFFAKGQKRHELGSGIEAFKGVYQSLRVAHSPVGGAHLTVNVDVANGTFFSGGLMKDVVLRFLGLRTEGEIGLLIRNDPAFKKKFNELKRLNRLHVHTMHRAGGNERDDYTISRFLTSTAANHVIDIKKDGKDKKVSIAQYFKENHGLKIYHLDWPLVEMTKKAILPLELLKLNENQRYPYKLDDRQTAAMIKVAVTPPHQRWGDIEHGLGMVNWAEDKYLKHYGMQIKTDKTVVKGRLLQNPKLQFSGSQADPKTMGRWDLKGKKFYQPNPAPLKSWGVCVVQGRYGPDKTSIDRFLQEFVKVYKTHGGVVETLTPVMQLGTSTDPGKCVEEVWNATGNKFKLRPQILVFILPDKDATVYGRIKRSCECRYGVVSQCMQIAHVAKCQPQYISNVLMKFNGKLGGVTNRAIGPTSSGATGVFKTPTCIIGADVSHGPPGIKTATSMAAMTVSTDKLATRYAAACETNGYRQEMILPENIIKLLKPLLQYWVQNVGGGAFPKHIIYVRDGVSEGQFAQVMEKEVRDMKAMLNGVNPNHGVKFAVIIASKRHHVRFFPKEKDPMASDRNGNPLPGTLIETGVTHPFENDFYLCAHAAIKGTARPVHYNVLLNETTLKNDDIYTMLYEHSYQYIRATTPVSLFPAVYYAHLASNRAGHHDKNFAGANSNERESQAQAKAKSMTGKTTSSGTPDEWDPLMPMPDTASITKSMWYI